MPVGRCVMRTAESVVLTCWRRRPRSAWCRCGCLPAGSRCRVLDLGQHRHRRRRGMDAALRLGRRHALHPVHAALILHPRIGAPAGNLGDHFLVAADFAGRLFHDLERPALQVGVALVHAQQIAGEQCRLVAAGPGPHFENDVLSSAAILGQQQDADVAFHLRDPGLELGDLGRRHLRHVPVARGGKLFGRAQLLVRLAPHRDRPHHGSSSAYSLLSRTNSSAAARPPAPPRRCRSASPVARACLREVRAWLRQRARSGQSASSPVKRGRGDPPTGGGGGGRKHRRKGPPPPPCCAWSPSPATRERNADCKHHPQITSPCFSAISSSSARMPTPDWPSPSAAATAPGSAELQAQHHFLDRPDGRRRHRKPRHADGHQRQRLDRPPRQLAAHGDRHRIALGHVDDVTQRPQPRHRDRIIGLVDPRIGAVGGVEEHDQVVRSDRDEIRLGQHMVELEQQRRHLDHGADLELARRRVAGADQPLELELHHPLGLDEFPGLGDHRHENLHRTAVGRRQQRAHLRAQQAGAIERQPQRAKAHRRVLLRRRAQIRNHPCRRRHRAAGTRSAGRR